MFGKPKTELQKNIDEILTRPDLQTQLESLLDCVWREEKYQRDMLQIEANCRLFDREKE